MHTKPLYKLFIVSLFFVLPLSMSQAYADSNSSSHVNAKKTPDQWLFVITAKEGGIKKNEKGQYVFTLLHMNIDRVLAFTDRPNRLVKRVKLKELRNLWGDKGNNSFKKDPPNAIAVFGQEEMAMTMISVSVDKDKTEFIVTGDDDAIREVNMMGNVSVFIDKLGVIPGVIFLNLKGNTPNGLLF